MDILTKLSPTRKLELASEFIDRLDSVQSIAELNDIVSEVFGHFGATHITGATVKGVGQEKDRYPLFGTYKSEWMQRYLAMHYYVDDTVFIYSQTATKATFWSDIYNAAKLTPAEQKIRAECAANGFSEGLIIPMTGLEGGRYVVSVSGPQFSRDNQTKTALVLMANYALGKARQIGAGIVQDVKVTDGQLRIMRWLADGLSQKDAAAVLQISEKTANNQVNSLKQALHKGTALGAAIELKRRGILT